MAKTMAKTASKALATWQEELAKDAQAAVATESSVQLGNRLSTKGGRFSFGGNLLKDTHIDLVVLDHVMKNTYYEGRYDPDNPASPVCFAFGTDEKTMAPHAESTKPQSKTCADCPQNKFGTSDTGKGKACKNIRELAVIPAEQLKTLATAEVGLLAVPVMSVKPWAAYVQQLAVGKLPPYAVVTTVSIEPDAKSQYRLGFHPAEAIDMSEHFAALKAKRAEAAPMLVVPYKPVEAQPAAAPRGKRKY